MILYRLVFIIASVLSYLTCLSSISVMTKYSGGATSSNDHSKNIQRVHQLREQGKQNIRIKNFKRASQCYSAVLQLLEGAGGTDALELRQKCGLTLAECEIKLGNLENAIARCSEIINEAPELSSIDETEVEDDDEDVKLLVGKALYRRGVCMKRLNKPKFAIRDFEESLKYVPDDEKVSWEVAILRGDSIFGEEEDVNEDDLEEQFIDMIEECQCEYPRNSFTKNQILSLCGLKTNSNVQSSYSNSKSRHGGAMQTAAGNNPFASAARGGFGNMGGFGDMGGLGGLGGLGGAGGLLGGLGGGKNIVEQMKNLLGMFGPMIGLDANTSKTLIEIIDAIANVGKLYNKIMEKFSLYRNRIIQVLTVAWVLSCLFPILQNKFHFIAKK